MRVKSTRLHTSLGIMIRTRYVAVGGSMKIVPIDGVLKQSHTGCIYLHKKRGMEMATKKRAASMKRGGSVKSAAALEKITKGFRSMTVASASVKRRR